MLGHFFTVGLFLTILGPLSGTLRFWQTEGPVISPAGSITTILGLVLVISSYIFCYRKNKTFPSITAIGCLISFLILFFSDWICRPYSLVRGPEIRGEIIVCSLIALYFISKNKLESFGFWSLVLASATLVILFLQAADGKFIFSDDHSVVIYRLSLLKENFPFIPFYNPLWNAGLDARDFFATGILNSFIIWSPLIYIFDVRDIYNLIVAGTIFVICPWATYYACRVDKQDKFVSALAGLICITSSLFWYRWCLKYGSMGFVTSTTLIPLNFILIKRLVCNQELTNNQIRLLILTVSLMLCWSLTGIIMLPFVLFGLFFIRSLIARPQVRKIILWLAAINIPWIILFLSASNVGAFISLNKNQSQQITATAHQQTLSKASVKGKAKPFDIKTVISHAREYATPSNAVVLSFGFLGILLIKDLILRRWLIVFTSWLLFLGFIVSPLKPQLELDRMLIVLGFLLSIPAASGIKSVIYTINNLFKSKLSYQFLSALPIGYLLAGTLSVGSIFWQRTQEIFTFVDEVYFDLGNAIKDNSKGGRAVFVGFVLHELNSGHLAPLMQQTKIPLVASSLYHNLWTYTELVPKSYLQKGPAGIEEYLTTINATLVIAHEKKWRDYFYARPNEYRFIGRYDVFNLFERVNHRSNYFLKGQGQVLSQNSNSVTFSVSSTDAELSFNYFPFLETSACNLGFVQVSPELKMVKVTECPLNIPITLKAKSGFRRLLATSNDD